MPERWRQHRSGPEPGAGRAINDTDGHSWFAGQERERLIHDGAGSSVRVAYREWFAGGLSELELDGRQPDADDDQRHDDDRPERQHAVHLLGVEPERPVWHVQPVLLAGCQPNDSGLTRWPPPAQAAAATLFQVSVRPRCRSKQLQMSGFALLEPSANPALDLWQVAASEADQTMNANRRSDPLVAPCALLPHTLLVRAWDYRAQPRDMNLNDEFDAQPASRGRPARAGSTTDNLAWIEAAGQGFEPQLPDPESGVLPLDDPATGRRPV
jgi:hypothetical protein